MLLLDTFANNILPVLLLSGAGFALGRALKIDPSPLGRVIFYILSPVLVFNVLISNNLPLARLAIMMGFTATGTLVIACLAFLIGKLFRIERGALIIVVLTSMCVNSGNFGLPLVSFAFGQEALAYASIYYVTSTLIFYTLGVIISSLGHLDLKGALLGLLKVPGNLCHPACTTFHSHWLDFARTDLTDPFTGGGWSHPCYAHPAWVRIAKDRMEP